MSDLELNSSDLIAINDESAIELPFCINTGSSRLYCSQLLRLLAGKRLVCKGSYQGQTVLLKIFFGASYKRRCQRELDGVRLIQREGINTPRLIASNIDHQAELAYIVFEYIDEVESLDERLKKSSTIEQRLTVFKQALELIAQMHAASIYQRDVHLDNFLLDDLTVYLIDGDQIEREAGDNGLADEFAVKNLAMFFTQLYAWEHSHIEPLLDFYVESRGQDFSTSFYQDIKRQLLEYKQWREKKYIEKKVFRRCSAFDVIKNWQQYCVYSREFDQASVEQFIDNPDKAIAQGEVLKSGRTAIVVKLELNGQNYVVKRYNKKSHLHQFARSLMPSRAAVSWKNGHLLEFNHIPTAKPLLMLENRWAAFRGRSYILTEYIEGCHAFDYFESNQPFDEREAVAVKINTLVKHLHLSGFVHGDLKAHNIWIKGNEPILIDLDGMQKDSSKDATMDDWQRLYRELANSDIKQALFAGINLAELSE
ncbi:hypothetical protein A9Q82_00755 [Cycloclasticus sp. 46_120_T64]|nr:hypothetical protein A9Q82_00755 [Cycloclasticus sp. 46_120_T64]